ncbi:MAG: ABC transporter permease [Oscillospiraceae bacterium]|jgi:peptide/nickel transport system permease protein|nr:ABC transporter permease [Oscillospiraceae bacterium]
MPLRIAKKLILLIVFMFALSAIVFWLARLAPHDPLYAYYGDAVERMSETQRAAAMSRLNLDKPIAAQYFAWLGNALRGDFGISYKYKQAALSVIGRLAPNTLLLGGISYILTFALAILLGVWCAVREGGVADRVIYRVGTATSVIPSFFIALIFILVFSVNLRLLPTSGAYSIGGGGFADRAVHLILPVAVMTLSHLWYYAYMIRNRVVEELRQDYVLLLRAKRLTTARVLRHCLRNMLPMLVTIMAVSVPHIIAGTYIVELVFGYPGIGTLTFESARLRDYNMLSVLTLLTGFVILLSNMAAQSLSEVLDVRMRHTGAINTLSAESVQSATARSAALGASNEQLTINNYGGLDGGRDDDA